MSSRLIAHIRIQVQGLDLTRGLALKSSLRPTACLSPKGTITSTIHLQRQGVQSLDGLAQTQRKILGSRRQMPRCTVSVRAAERKGFGDEEKIAAQQTQPKERPAPLQLGEPPRSARERQIGQGFQEVPEIVNNRMLGRIVLCAGLPTFTGFALFPFFYWLRVAQGIKVPMPAVYGVQFVTFGAGLVGITYGILSASWDPKKEGSWLGLAEFKTNVPNVLASLKKNR